MSSSPCGSGSVGPSIVRVGFYEIERTIGKGNFAVVKLARHRITKTQVAIKIIDKKRLDEENLEKIYREVQILKLLEHPNIIKLYQVMETSNMVYIVSEYAENGEVFEYIAKKGRLSEDEAHTKFTQILDAVDYCHQSHVVHRDLKAENLLLDSEMNIKIADFGFGNFFTSNQDLSTWCGSPPYAAPEVFEGQKYVGPRIDVWSLGVILYVLVCGSLPFDGHDFPTLRDRVLSGRFRIPYFMSTDCENLIKKILVLDPKRRYTIPQIRRHRWVTSRMVVYPIPSPIRLPQRRCDRDLDDCALRLMQNLGMDLQKITEAIKTDAFNHYTAIYYLLLEKLLKHRTAYINMATTGTISPTRNVPLVASGTPKEIPPRRPSSIADQAMMPRPVLAETKQGPFSHTTDCVQVPLINLINEKGAKEGQLTEISSDLSSQKKISVDEGVDMDCGSACSRDNSQDLPFIPSGRRMHGSYREALRDLSQNSSASFQSIGTGISESPQVSFDLEAETTSSSLQYDASAAQIYPESSFVHPAIDVLSRTSEPSSRILHPNTLPRLPFTRTSLALSNLTSPTVTMTPPFSTKFYHPNNGSSGLSVSGLGESGGNGGSGCQVGGPDVRDARSPVNFREGRRASDEFLASAVKNNAVPFRQRLRETSKAWAVVTELSCSTDKSTCIGSGEVDEASRNKDLEIADQAMVDFPSEERAQVLHRRNIIQTQLNNYLFKPSLLVPAAMVAVGQTGMEVIPPALQFRFQHLQIDHGKPLDPRIISHPINPIDYSMPQRTAMLPNQLESFDASNSSRVKRRRFVRQASYRLSQGSEGELSSTSWLPSSEPLSPTFEVMEDEEEDEEEEKRGDKEMEERDVCDMEC